MNSVNIDSRTYIQDHGILYIIILKFIYNTSSNDYIVVK